MISGLLKVACWILRAARRYTFCQSTAQAGCRPCLAPAWLVPLSRDKRLLGLLLALMHSRVDSYVHRSDFFRMILLGGTEPSMVQITRQCAHNGVT